MPMTKTLLNDPIWSRLPGPYGVEGVNKILSTLDAEWSDEVANDLFWEKLHHQDDIYPVTYAALPWVFESAQKAPNTRVDALVFCSHVLRCAMLPYGTGSDGQGPRGKYRGLPVMTENHANRPPTSEQGLVASDLEFLKALEDWFDLNSNRIAQICFDAISEESKFEAVYLSAGTIALSGGEQVICAMEMWSEDEAVADIVSELHLSGADRRLALEISRPMSSKNRALSEFLADLSQAVPRPDDEQPVDYVALESAGQGRLL